MVLSNYVVWKCLISICFIIFFLPHLFQLPHNKLFFMIFFFSVPYNKLFIIVVFLFYSPYFKVLFNVGFKTSIIFLWFLSFFLIALFQFHFFSCTNIFHHILFSQLFELPDNKLFDMIFFFPVPHTNLFIVVVFLFYSPYFKVPFNEGFPTSVIFLWLLSVFLIGLFHFPLNKKV